MIRPLRRAPLSMLIAAMPIVALTACGGEKDAKPPREAASEVLPGSVSDAMLPLDTVRSHAPLAQRATESGKQGAEKATAPSAGEPEAASPATQAEE